VFESLKLVGNTGLTKEYVSCKIKTTAIWYNNLLKEKTRVELVSKKHILKV